MHSFTRAARDEEQEVFLKFDNLRTEDLGFFFKSFFLN